MDTPEMAQLYRRYQRCERLAKAYNCVLDDRTGDPLLHLVIDPEGQTLTPVLRLGLHVVAIPKTIPRDRPTAWYVAKYVEYRAKADNAHDLYWALCDAQKKRAYEAMSREEKLSRLHQVGDHLARADEELVKWRAKLPAWEREQEEQDPAKTKGDALAQAYMASLSDPRPMIATLEDAKREREAERDWLLEHI
jgi:hypothetical protein